MAAMREPLFRGVGVALVTLFDDAGDLDVEATATLAASLVEAGMRCILVAGSTGEAATLEPAERIALVEGVRKAVDGAVPVLAGTGAPSARQAARLTADAADAGADAALVLSPPGSVDLPGYYGHVIEANPDLPVLAYHYTKMSSPGIDVDVLPALAALGVTGLKDSSGDVARLLRTLDDFPAALYVGSPWVVSTAGAVGATGALLAVANVEPELSVAAFAGDLDAQRALTPVIVATAGPPGIKAALAERAGWSPRTRA